MTDAKKATITRSHDCLGSHFRSVHSRFDSPKLKRDSQVMRTRSLPEEDCTKAGDEWLADEWTMQPWPPEYERVAWNF